ncbi:acyl-CoA dehydrogenase family protein [candidate division KSB1 bacterium]|nr:acyl-CoA dehydrogenase family protein [candidate division KSB1 bacterium]
MLAAEEIAKQSASVAASLAVSTATSFAILAFGTENQKKKYLPPLAKGEFLASFALAEPGGGANWTQTTSTRAVLDGDFYVINGSKMFVSNAGEAQVYIVVVRTDPAKGPGGISAFLIEKDTPGFSIGTVEKKLGLRGDPTAEVVLEDCRVPKENMLGQEGDVMKVAFAYGGLDCAGQAAAAVGLAQAALDETTKYVKERTIVGATSLANIEVVQSTITEMTMAVESARYYNFSSVMPLGKPGMDPRPLIAAINAKEMAIDVTGKAILLHGGYGCTTDFPLERYFRDAKTLSMTPPSMTMIKSLVGKILLDVPLGPPPKK